MKRNFKYLTKSADSSGKVMESGDHFKNGATPKSQTEKQLRIKN
jgi:hypothetical protein